MPLFMCSKCGCIENTALGYYWNEMMDAHQENRAAKPLCSLCRTGKWHDQFPYESAKGWLLASDGFIYSKADAESEKKRFKDQKISIVKEITGYDLGLLALDSPMPEFKKPLPPKPQCSPGQQKLASKVLRSKRGRVRLYERKMPVVAHEKIGRNVPCPCGSGKKYKKCCGA